MEYRTASLGDPMLHVYRSNRLEVLAQVLAGLLDQPQQRPADPFRPVRVVVGSRGMERWLRHKLALQPGAMICANVQFPFPAQVVSQALGSDRDPWRPDALAWAILQLVPDLLDRPQMAPLRAFWDGDGRVGPRQWGLARRLADVFDRYINYRPRMAVEWSQGRAPGVPADLAWQPLLWQALESQLGGTHLAARSVGALETLQPFDQPLRVFGVTSLPPFFFRWFEAISRRQDVDLFVVTPSNRYWADLGRALKDEPPPQLREELGQWVADRVPTVHPLLRSLGRIERDLQVTLESLGDGQVDRTDDEWFIQAPGTALGLLQDDITQQRVAPELAPRLSVVQDGTIQFHACHGPTRQVEVLRDQLLHLLDQDPTLQPRDVIVMTPDIEQFAPLIQATFEQGRDHPQDDGWGPSGAPRLPFQIADRSLRRVNPVAEVLLQILGLAAPSARLTATALIDLLGLEPLRQRFDLAAEDLPQVESWLREAGVRWGLDAADRAAHDQPKDPQNTLFFGLQRLALGAAVGDAGGGLFDDGPGDRVGVAPFDPGPDTALLGRVLSAVSTIVDELEALRGPRPVADWVARLLGDPAAPLYSPAQLGTIERLTRVPGSGRWLVEGVRAALVALAEEAADASAALPVQVAALQAVLAGRFEIASPSPHTQTGALTFASMAPYRSVPYRVVALLGMDAGAFPRNPTRLGFDLVQRHPRAGDRSPRDEDRHLFLEAILSARSHLLVFYTGADVRTNEDCAPAVPVGELRDAIDASFPAVDDQPPSECMTHRHPLQGFSPRAFDGSGPRSYDRRLLRAAQALAGVRAEPLLQSVSSAPLAQAEDLPLYRVVRFFKNPAKAWLSGALGLRLDADLDAPVDREPVALGGLERWSVRQRALAECLDSPPEADDQPSPAELQAVRRLRAEGLLPLGVHGQRELHGAWLLGRSVAQAAAPWLEGGWGAPVPVALPLLDGAVTLTGSLGPRCGRDLLFFRVGSETSATSWIEPWLQALTWAAVDPSAPCSAILFVADPKKTAPALVRFAFMPDATPAQRGEGARALLDGVVSMVRQGSAGPFPFMPRSSYALAVAAHKRKTGPITSEEWSQDADSGTLDTYIDKARRVWVSGYDSGEDADPYVQRAWGDVCPYSDPEHRVRAGRLALDLWTPCLDARITQDQPFAAPGEP